MLTTHKTSGALNEKLPSMSLKFTRIEDLGDHNITAFHGKLKGLLYSQGDDTNVFPSHLHNMNELCAFHHKHP